MTLWSLTYQWKLIPSAEEQQDEGLLRRAAGRDRKHMGPSKPEDLCPDSQDARSAHPYDILSTQLTTSRYGTRRACSQAQMRGPPPNLGKPDEGARAISRALQQAEATSFARSNTGNPSERCEGSNPPTSTEKCRRRSCTSPVSVAPTCPARWRPNRSAQLLSSQSRVLKDATRPGRAGGMESAGLLSAYGLPGLQFGGQGLNHSGTEVPATPSGHLPLRNPRSLAFASTPRAGVGTTTSAPGSGRFHRTASGSHMNVTGGIRGFSGTKGGDAGLRRPVSGDGLEVSRPPLMRAEGLYPYIFMPATPKLTRLALPGPSRASPQLTARQTSQHSELSGPIFRNP